VETAVVKESLRKFQAEKQHDDDYRECLCGCGQTNAMASRTGTVGNMIAECRLNYKVNNDGKYGKQDWSLVGFTHCCFA